MRKVILMVALMVVSGSAMAEWVKFSEDNENITYYESVIDYTETKSGKMAVIVFLNDVRAKSEGQSTKTQYQYNCQNDMIRQQSTDLYDGHMANGNILVSDHEPKEWQQLSATGKWHKLACM